MNKENNKRITWGVMVIGAILIVAGFLVGRYAFPNDQEELLALPAPTLSEGERGALGIDANVNEDTLDMYLGRDDIVYRDLRFLDDPANYEAIGGDSKLSGFVEGFEVVPFPYIVNVEGLPSEVGETYSGPTLYTQKDGAYIANYGEALTMLESLFPKDKTLFLMCGGGGYAGMAKQMLVSLGWDADKIYDVGGYWYYNGDNAVEVRRTAPNGTTVYDFYKVPYHVIDFDRLTKVGA